MASDIPSATASATATTPSTSTDSTGPASPAASPVTVIGLGPMGSALARAFLRAGHPTTVWNRTAAKAEPLVAEGAVRADTVAEAAAASPLVVVCVIDYAAAEQVLAPAADSLKGRTVVHLTADTPTRARAMADWARQNGVDYIDGAIMTHTETIGGPSAVFLYSGPADLYAEHRPTLDALGGTATHLGEDPGRAASFDVALLDAFWTAMSGFAHAFALARAEGVAAGELAPFAAGISELLGSSITEIAAHLDAGTSSGAEAAIVSAAAGMEHVVEASEARGLDSGIMRAALAAARRVVDSGRGDAGFETMVDAMALQGGQAAAR
ncbi:NAD(P)-dependent oxidoreductase [Streptomonospora nanhaiensis]|uniref:3-hydroxyisobutyrate dehydrogenase-like beta-hydroxyacid dehydrogenase n=1 Tax=Streptomonospora nanhaiensis TaxID=1323731 RepID=A0A853BRX9_9ACTN|nr:NAD(P)-binding domain-containing protein [Streptomonospora nanhaiensis]MBV2362239.1 NAD(P)-binding domain-containing protein [Streptomonospora nanhaiensis]MBX9387831.1 NAD(P)-binding domain-containing protein [Streptomonospora nanhaiensis]NYI97307.1 3-hydroxyisobutyrate dehydrogenase-like beta-hydroxyacid dehydrogenase [Streptomonospora nanhaiensis]